MSSRGSAVLAHVKSIGDAAPAADAAGAARSRSRPTSSSKILQDLKLGHPPAVAGRIDLDEALRNGWIEFWYQPKIDLRKKQLVGAEAFARARHPQYGVLMPARSCRARRRRA